MSTNTLGLRRDRGVLTLTLSRPERMNALSAALVADLHHAVAEASASPDDRVVVVTGAGRAFSAGADLDEASALAADPAGFRRQLEEWRLAFRALEECPKPVVAAVNGITVAGGLELALACDVVVASSAARIGDGHVRYGLVPGGGGSQRLPEAVGLRAARWLMYTGRMLDAADAAALGLVQCVLPADGFEEAVHDLAVTMAGRSSEALAFMKAMTSPATARDTRLAQEIDGATRVVTGVEAREGLAAFAEKREPDFGRARRSTGHA